MYRKILFLLTAAWALNSIVVVSPAMAQLHKVPDVVGMHKDEAITAFTSVDFSVPVEKYEYSETVLRDHVISQNPPGGTLRLLSARVTLTISLGSGTPVYFADADLKAAVEAKLGVTDPMQGDMLGLTSLDVRGSHISSLQGLQHADNLGHLLLTNNQLDNIGVGWLAGMTNLTYLDVGDNQISNINWLYGFMDLTGLVLRGNEISNLLPLAGLTNLTGLGLGDNQISNINSLSGLKNLKTLDLSVNEISDLSPLSGLTNLIVLDLGVNQIRGLSALAGLTYLSELDLSVNQIGDLSPLADLRGLFSLDIRNNPLNPDAFDIYIPQIQAYAWAVSYGPIALLPDVVGMSENEAVSEMTSLGLGTSSTYQYSHTIAAGRVISQDPAAGKTVGVGFAMQLVVSLSPSGPDLVSVPDVTGMTQSQAASALTSAGLSLGSVSHTYSDSMAAGQVISQSPAAGTTVEEGSAVNVTVSLGSLPAGQVAVPDVVGLTLSQAKSMLAAAGLTLGGASMVYTDLAPAGQVMSQSPQAGTMVNVGYGVELNVSVGPEGNNTLVPTVVGWPESEVEGALLADGLVVGTKTWITSDTVPEGQVISQTPSPWTLVSLGSEVDLVLSLGPQGAQTLTVPNVVGMTQAQAASALSSAGLILGNVSQAYSDSVATGRVISQSPGAGTTVNAGSTVHVTISLGPPEPDAVAVPNVVGMTQAQAASAVGSAGLVLGSVSQAYSSSVVEGHVISQSPGAGTTANAGSAVHLTISLGPPEPDAVSVPSVVGMTQSQAESTLLAAGLAVGAKWWSPNEQPRGTVISQQPKVGQRVAAGSAVQLTLSQGPSENPVPNPDLPAPSPVAHWKLDETEGLIAFDSAGENDGLVYGHPTWVPGLIDGALQLDGVDDYVDCGNDPSLDMTAAITLAAWIKPRDMGHGQDNPYVTKGDRSYAVKGFREGSSIEFFIYDNGHHTAHFTGAAAFNREWHHVAGTYDGSEIGLYIDGALESVTDYVGSIASTTCNLNIGRNAEHIDRFYRGVIDDVRIYDQALSESQIQQVMAPPIPGLVGCWKLDESSGRTATDSSGNGHDGIVQGYPLWLPDGGMIGGGLDFDGLNDFVQIDDHPDFDLTEHISVAAWIRVDTFDEAWQAVVGKGDGAWRMQRDDLRNAMEFSCTGLSVPGTWGQVLGDVNVNDGQWHHVAGVYDGSRISLYVDGVLDTSSIASGTIATNEYAVTIGENSEQRGRYWNGQIDDVRVYEQPLTESEIQAVMTGAVSVPVPGQSDLGTLIAHWTFDEAEGSLAHDDVSGLDGILIRGPVWRPEAGKVNGALEFDGSDDWVVTDFVLNPADGPFGAFAWIRGDARDRVVISQDGSQNGADWLLVDGTGQLATRLPAQSGRFVTTLASRTVVADGDWHEVGLVWDGTNRALYSDGVEVATDVLTSARSSSGGLNIAAGANLDRGSFFSGLIDDVRIYYRAEP